MGWHGLTRALRPGDNQRGVDRRAFQALTRLICDTRTVGRGKRTAAERVVGRTENGRQQCKLPWASNQRCRREAASFLPHPFRLPNLSMNAGVGGGTVRPKASGRPNGEGAKLRGQGLRAEAEAARRLPAHESRDAGGVTPSRLH